MQRNPVVGVRAVVPPTKLPMAKACHTIDVQPIFACAEDTAMWLRHSDKTHDGIGRYSDVKGSGEAELRFCELIEGLRPHWTTTVRYVGV